MLTPGSGCSLVRMFPLGDLARCDSKQRMCHRMGNAKVTTMDGRTAPPQLAQKPTPLVLQLSVGDENTLSGTHAAKFGSVERIAAKMSFGVNARKITVDRSTRRSTRLKPYQLRVSAITICAPTKHFAGEQRLPPKRN